VSAPTDRSALPAGAPDELDLPFWEACRRHELLVHRCGRCGRSYWPATCCVEHGGEDMAWVPAAGTGMLHTWTVYHHAYTPEMADRLPYVVAVVRLDEGPFLHTGLVGCGPDDCAVGLPVEVVFVDRPDGTTFPHFRPIS
jgi:uncharacterized protein